MSDHTGTAMTGGAFILGAALGFGAGLFDDDPMNTCRDNTSQNTSCYVGTSCPNGTTLVQEGCDL